MFRILVTDDEGVMLESIKSIILSNFGSEYEAMCVKTGQAVVEQAKAFRPDITFVDIQMPRLSGIQAIREVRKFNSSMVFIIITAYNRFSCAQEAVNLGVVEFTTKPVDKKKMLGVSIRAVRQVKKTRQKLSDNLKIRKELELVVPMIESGFIYSLLQNDTDTYGGDYLDVLDIRKQYGFMVVLEFGDNMTDGLMTNAVGANVRANKHYNQLRELVKDHSDCIIGPIMGNRIVLLTPFDSEKTHYEERAEIITRARDMIYRLEGAINTRSRDGIGTMKPVRDTESPYREALRALRGSNSHVVHVMNISTVTNYGGEYPPELEVQYFQRGVKTDREGTAGCANEFFDWMVARAGNVRANIEVEVLELVMRLEQKMWEMGCVQYGFRYGENHLSEVQGTEGMNTPQHWFIRKTREIYENISTLKERENENIVSRVKGYINENFARDISLDGVLRLVDTSPYYLGKLFRREVGENFIKYLTRTRIGHARQLLGDPRYSIKEVCIICGYSNPDYFSRIFKKYERKTPSEYRER